MTAQDIITAAAVLAALAAIGGYVVKCVHFVDRQKKQEEALADLQQRHGEDMQAIKNEQTVICYGVLACLKGLAEQGCDGPVHDAIDCIEKHLNKRAHS